MANFLNNLTSQLSNPFNSAIGLKIGKCGELNNLDRRLAVAGFIDQLMLRNFSIFLLENFTSKRNNKHIWERLVLM